MPTKTQTTRLLDLARRQEIIRPRDLDRCGIPRMVLKRLVDRGDIIRRGRGIYARADLEPSTAANLADIAKRLPRAVICLLSALRFHEVTTQNPFEIWVMIDRTSRKPVIDYPPIRLIRASGPAIRFGIEHHTIHGVKVRVTNPAKTVADCFRHRNKIGIDVAIEALRVSWRRRKASMNDLHRFAKMDRVANVMRPYMESLV